MSINDLVFVFIWWMVLLVLTFVNYPLTARLFSFFVDRGYIFAKILGILLISYIVYVLGILHIAPFTFTTVIGVLLVLVLINLALFLQNTKSVAPTATTIKLSVTEEFLFLLVLLAWSYVRAHQPAIEGLEKLMDYGFVKSILNSHFFPPRDMWLASAPIGSDLKPEVANTLQGFYINYYYFGHLVTAVLTRLSQLPPAITYNLQLATLAAFTFAGSFSLGVNLLKTETSESAPLRGTEDLTDDPTQQKTAHVKSSLSEPASSNTNQKRNRRTTPKRGTELISVSLRKLILAGLLTAFLVTFSGNLHTIYSFTPGYQIKANEFPPPPWSLQFDTSLTDYWYPNATRFIPYTIHEFPSYSSIVADLHGHFSNIPFVLLILAVLLVLIRSTKLKTKNEKRKTTAQDLKANQISSTTIQSTLQLFAFRFSLLVLIGFLLAIFYMTNSWDTLVYGLLSVAVLAIVNAYRIQGSALSLWRRARGIIFTLTVIALSFLIFSVPFSYFFHPFSSKIGVNCGYRILDSLGVASFFQETPASIAYSDLPAEPQTISIGPLLFEPNNCQRTPLWMHFILWGFFYYIIFGFVLFILWPSLKSRALKIKKSSALKANSTKHLEPRALNLELKTTTNIFMILMILLSLFLLWVPEFAYIKDIYPAHFRANTMFKLGYQAFIMLSIVAGYTITQLIKGPTFNKFKSWTLKKTVKGIYIALLLPQLFLILIYPLFGINSYYNGLRSYKGLYGLNWLRERHPDDYSGVLWLDGQTQTLCQRETTTTSDVEDGKRRTLREHNCPVILEAVGDSYTEYARVSANTGLPTVLGWPVHEWLWRGSYDEAGKRKGEIETIYTSQNTRQVKELLTKYSVEYIFVGELERQKYPKLTEKVFQDLGTVVYQSNNTRIYKL